MNQEQISEPLEPAGLVERARSLHAEGYRLVHICATPLPDFFELLYSFDRHGRLVNLRLEAPRQGAVLPSISSVYHCAFIYENELHDLFNISVEGMNVDFKGEFYKTSIQFAFGTRKIAAAKATPNTGPNPPAQPSSQPGVAFPA